MRFDHVTTRILYSDIPCISKNDTLFPQYTVTCTITVPIEVYLQIHVKFICLYNMPVLYVYIV